GDEEAVLAHAELELLAAPRALLRRLRHDREGQNLARLAERDPRLRRHHVAQRAVAVARERLVEPRERLGPGELALFDLVERLLPSRRVSRFEKNVADLGQKREQRR